MTFRLELILKNILEVDSSNMHVPEVKLFVSEYYLDVKSIFRPRAFRPIAYTECKYGGPLGRRPERVA